MRHRRGIKDRLLAFWDSLTYLFWRGVQIAADALYWV